MSTTLQIFKELQVNYRKMMVDYSLVAHQRIVGFSCYSYMKLQVCTVICYCHYHQAIRVQFDQCRMPRLLQAKYNSSVKKESWILFHIVFQRSKCMMCYWAFTFSKNKLLSLRPPYLVIILQIMRDWDKKNSST